MIQKTTRAVLFDADNTLLASNKFVFDNIKNTVKRLQSNGSHVITPADQEITNALSKNLPFEEIFKNLFPGIINNEQIWKKVLADYRKHAPEIPYESTPGSLEAVRYLKQQNIKVGIVTNRVKMLEKRLTQAGFDINDFVCLCPPPSKEEKKPHPNAFSEALDCLKKQGIHNDQIVVFGDHTDDYFSAKANSIKFVAVLQGNLPKDNFIEAGLDEKLIIKSLENFKDAIENANKMELHKRSLQNTSALDGRYYSVTHELQHHFSEYALHKNRIKVEIEHVIALSEFFDGKVVRQLTNEEKNKLRELYQNFSWHDAYEVLEYDHLGRNGIGPTEHDVKSCELWIQEKLKDTKLEDISSFIHIFLTSGDVNNLAYKLMLSGGVNEVFLPKLFKITDKLCELTQEYKADPLMGRTHVQPASPTTFGKIFGGYLSRLTDGLQRLKKVTLTGKVNGAVGNYNTFVAAYPNLDWISYSKHLCSKLDFDVNLYTDQRGTHADMTEAFQTLQEIGNVIRDLATDLSLYAAIGTIYFTKVESHVGSSVMPHKINPWFAEVAEGNIKKVNYHINCFSNEMDVSRLQRDLSDHDYERSYGEVVGYIVVAIDHLMIALNLIRPDTEFAKKELMQNYQVVTEALQTILRKHGDDQAYYLLKKHFRGKRVTSSEINKFIDICEVSDDVKKELRSITEPTQYIGLADKLAQSTIAKYKEFAYLAKPYKFLCK